MSKFNKGNQVVIKNQKAYGYVQDIVDNLVLVGTVSDDETLTLCLFPETDLELKPCEHGSEGYCNFTSKSKNTCKQCELVRLGIEPIEEPEEPESLEEPEVDTENTIQDLLNAPPADH